MKGQFLAYLHMLHQDVTKIADIPNWLEGYKKDSMLLLTKTLTFAKLQLFCLLQYFLIILVIRYNKPKYFLTNPLQKFEF